MAPLAPAQAQARAQARVLHLHANKLLVGLEAQTGVMGLLIPFGGLQLRHKLSAVTRMISVTIAEALRRKEKSAIIIS